MNHKPPSDLSRWLAPWHTQPVKIALLYALVSGVWIITSDTAVHLFAPDQQTANFINIIKGWAFVAATAGMLWLLVHRLLIRIVSSEADLRKSEEQARAVFNGVTEAIFIHDAETGAILEVNDTACTMFGYAREEFPQLTVGDLSSGTPPYTQEGALKICQQALSGTPVTAEWCSRRRDGSLFWTEVNARLAVIGDQTRLLVTSRDISERKKASDQVRKLSQAVEQSPVSIVITDRAGTIEYINPATCRLTGYSNEELIGETPRIFKSRHTPREIYELLWSTILQGGEWHGEFENRKKNGELYWETASISPITDKSGEITHFLAVKENITDRKRAEKELHESRARLRALLARLQDAREQERTRISREIHDVLGQLLTGLKMDLSWLERRLPRLADDALREELAAKLAETNALGDSMLECVQKISRDLRPSLLDNLGLAAALQFEARQFANRTGIACEIAGMPENLAISPDRATHVFRIFQEILTNVARHAGATQVNVSLLREGDEVSLEVRDNGRGLKQGAIGDADSLGLLGMSERASLIGGRIRFRGIPDEGTTVNLTLPERTPQDTLV
jgi:PAS domain S-box-containing protein